VTPSLTGEIFAGQTDQLILAMSQAVTAHTAISARLHMLPDGMDAH
jgi:hypothetical protein